MTAPSVARDHWLVDVVRRAGVVGADRLRVVAGISIDDAWTAVATGCNISSDELTARVAKQYAVKVADPSTVEARALRMLPESVARRFSVIPLRESDRYLVVATAVPFDHDAETAIGFAAGRSVTFEVAAPQVIRAALDERYSPNLVVEALVGKLSVDGRDTVRLLDSTGVSSERSELDAAPVVRLTSLVIQHAITHRASDIQIELGPTGGHVRIRVDGVVQPAVQMPQAVLGQVIARIKLLAKIDGAGGERAQHGRARIQVEAKTYDLRISTVPSRDWEKIVVRVIDPSATPALEALGMPAQELARLRGLLQLRDGLIIVTGPAGSGRTTTAYSAIREMARLGRKVTSVEDPVEYEMEGITQVQADPKRNITLASALRAIPREGADVIHVSEIRDRETAELAVQTAASGRLVIASLGTNNAVGVVAWLRDIGLGSAAIAKVLRGVVGQRLVRQLCDRCKVAVASTLTPNEVLLSTRHGITPLLRAAGCPRCNNSGYRGRAAVAEVLVCSTDFSNAVAAEASVADLDALARSGGMRTMRQVATELVVTGSTSIDEFDRVVGGEADVLAITPAPTSPPVEEHRVLVIDDDVIIRTLVKALLTKAGMKVAEAGDGFEALTVLSGSSEFDLVLLDLDMPRLGGLETLKRIRSNLTTAGLPTIILTGSDSVTDEVAVMDAGADDYVRKPIVPDRLMTRIRSVLRRAAS